MARKYGTRMDANHREIFDVMRQVGTAVYDLSKMGNGVPDGIAWVSEQWRLFEVKNPKTGYGKRGLNKVQKKWLGQWAGGPIYILRTVDQALAFARGRLDNLECVTSEQCRVEMIA